MPHFLLWTFLLFSLHVLCFGVKKMNKLSLVTILVFSPLLMFPKETHSRSLVLTLKIKQLNSLGLFSRETVQLSTITSGSQGSEPNGNKLMRPPQLNSRMSSADPVVNLQMSSRTFLSWPVDKRSQVRGQGTIVPDMSILTLKTFRAMVICIFMNAFKVRHKDRVGSTHIHLPTPGFSVFSIHFSLSLMLRYIYLSLTVIFNHKVSNHKLFQFYFHAIFNLLWSANAASLLFKYTNSCLNI